MYKDVGAGKATRRRGNPKISNRQSRIQRQEALLSGHLVETGTIADLWWQLLEKPSEPERTRNTLTYFFTHVVVWIVPLKNSLSPGTSWCELIWKSNDQGPYKKGRRRRDRGEKATWRWRLEWRSYKTRNKDIQSQQKLGETREDFTLEPLEEMWPWEHLDVRPLASRTEFVALCYGSPGN